MTSFQMKQWYQVSGKNEVVFSLIQIYIDVQKDKIRSTLLKVDMS